MKIKYAKYSDKNEGEEDKKKCKKQALYASNLSKKHLQILLKINNLQKNK